MKIDKLKIRQSPYIGVFCSITDEIALVPKDITSAEFTKIKNFDVEILKTKIVDSTLLGVLMSGLGTKFVAPDLLSKDEEDFFSSKGIELLAIGNKAYGNIMALNSNGGIVSTIADKETFREIKKFFGLKLVHKAFSCTDLVGSSLVVTEKGFIVNPEIKETEFKLLKKTFKVEGQATTSNYGDIFVGNGVIANSNAVFAGDYTTGTELMRIDEGLRGE